jgi:hypothetical protein
MKPVRIYVYPKDVMQFTGKGIRTSQNILARIKRIHGKLRHQHVTLREFADYMKIHVDDIGTLE